MSYLGLDIGDELILYWENIEDRSLLLYLKLDKFSSNLILEFKDWEVTSRLLY